MTGVYFIGGGSLVKIGQSADVAKRFRTLQCSCPIELTLIGVLECDLRSLQGVESWLHTRYQAQRRHGEWFAPIEEMLAFAHGEIELGWMLPSEVCREFGLTASSLAELPCWEFSVGPRGGARFASLDYDEIALRVDIERARKIAKEHLQAAFGSIDASLTLESQQIQVEEIIRDEWMA